jgi:predicted lipoprotein with Yx(FWY)xxD motif
MGASTNTTTEEIVPMTRAIPLGAAAAASLILAACGGGGGGNSSAGATTGSGSTNQASGAGKVLVDRSGKALYTPDQKVLCDGACTSFWKPAAPGAVPQSAGKLAVIKRPDGSKQVTVDGKPVYTFVEDSPGKVKGDGFEDDFGGTHFTWHAVVAGGKSAPSSSSTSDNKGYGY